MNDADRASDDQRDGVIAQVDSKGVCENCGHHAYVVSHGHESLDGGSVSRGDDEVRCELTSYGGEVRAE
ncbi:hypothetical protein [Halorubrum lacusprofundi]|uniref:Uncharacterized protein n=1 Tax=Halorubrum lacusprofundi (strain ATCC 49239 / DSM 5036 / JCM 8891 / ACAM 34) TaxID=416348 RepID=B9LUI6_HALLT|nr:hypothetical protein [Halorubrum lacusprofundi]ACM56343.1 hypothetical protein Hlac_0743 [Halorubrum lacusprofundi ATCC 49239]